MRIFAEYKRQGFQTAIDDFGAGYAGLNLLAEFQPDFLKIDVELTRHIDRDLARPGATWRDLARRRDLARPGAAGHRRRHHRDLRPARPAHHRRGRRDRRGVQQLLRG